MKECIFPSAKAEIIPDVARLQAAFPDVDENAWQGLVFLSQAGSKLHGVKVEGKDDDDYIGVFVEPLDYLMSNRSLDHQVRSTGSAEARNSAEDIDLTLYSMRKFFRLLAKGNPTIYQLLWAEPIWESPNIWIHVTSFDCRRDLFVHKGLLSAFLGYARAQRSRLMGERGQMRVNRRELVSAHGYDTKYAAHIFRLVHQGLEVIERSHLTLPVPEPARSEILSVRLGEVPKAEMLERMDWLLSELAVAIDSCGCRSSRHDEINKLCAFVHRQYYGI